MPLALGDTVWIPCEVRHGVFPDQRHVSIHSPAGHWVGCVDVRQLRDEILDGPTAIRGTIVESHPGKFVARLPGQTMRHQYLTVIET